MPNQEENTSLYMRRGADKISKLIKGCILASWGFGIAALVLACAAMPIIKELFSNIFETQLSSSWSFTFLMIDFYLTVITFIVSVTGLYLTSLRQRRRADHYNISMIIIGILSAISIIIYLIFF